MLPGPAGASSALKVARSGIWGYDPQIVIVGPHSRTEVHDHNKNSQTRPSNYAHACLHPRAARIGPVGVLLARGPRARVRQGRAGATMAVIVPNCDFW